MMEPVPITEAGMQLGSLVRRTSRARVTITEHGEPAAVLINPLELEKLEEAGALAGFRAQQATGTVPPASSSSILKDCTSCWMPSTGNRRGRGREGHHKW